ncbi:glucose-6-phosphate dehydrogenase assembly protein OpcA [Streptacidiphilus monticola]|uniref:Glucose-6-phosphate dehydrogenase assembly protein OpcA n=1 Tax=Streptacidiphilus monticola TaxID=2161674 RepID=A0ABW1G7K0_9ACTN
MRIHLTDTNSSKVNAAIIEARRAAGASAVGMVLTLVIVTDEGGAYDAHRAASEASMEHPCRIVTVVRRPGRSPRARAEARLDAEVIVGAETGSGESVVLRLHGELAGKAESVVLPLLLPDAPVVVWWPDEAPDDPAGDPLGKLAQRRITDSYNAADPLAFLAVHAESYAPGDTDLAWTRLTLWRSLLSAALDQSRATVTGATVECERDNASAELLASWLGQRLGVPVSRVTTEGPLITRVSLATENGDISIDRPEGPVANFAMPGQTDRVVALKIRPTSELIAEELRRLDPDTAYAEALRGTRLIPARAAG